MLPFAPEVFLALFADYNRAIWPAQVGAWLLGLAALALCATPVRAAGRIVYAVLALFWAFTGLAYHWNVFAQINIIAPAFAALFWLQAALFAGVAALAPPQLAFRRGAAGWAGMAIALYALFVYPLTSFAAGHPWPMLPAFGVTPSPLGIFTLGILLMARPHPPLGLAILPLVWAVIGIGAVWLLGMVEDVALPVAALVYLLLAGCSRLTETRRAAV